MTLIQSITGINAISRDDAMIDATEAEFLILRCINALGHMVHAVRRLDPAYCESHEVKQVTDNELEDVLMYAEDMLDMADSEKPSSLLVEQAKAVRLLHALGDDMCHALEHCTQVLDGVGKSTTGLAEVSRAWRDYRDLVESKATGVTQ
jgi:hypothetical protein